MDLFNVKYYEYTPFSVESVKIPNKSGTWASTKISIFREKILIGEYIRNYDGFGTDTFCPFKVNNEWYALYSANYTCVRVMKLHSNRIEDWCGEETVTGFCPIEIYIPKYIHSQFTLNDDNSSVSDIFYVDCDYDINEFRDIFLNKEEFISLDSCNFGFISGCIWGDDSSRKLRYIDLSQIENKILKIESKFGYWELPQKRKLHEVIHMDDWEPGSCHIVIDKMERVNLRDNNE